MFKIKGLIQGGIIKIKLRTSVVYDNLSKIMSNHISLSHRKLDIRVVTNNGKILRHIGVDKHGSTRINPTNPM